MTYKLNFKKSALKEWNKLGSTLQQQFKKKLIERLENPHVLAAKLSGADKIYKIKLRQSGYRLVYKVEDDIIIVTVLAVGKRERNNVYSKAMKRIDSWLRYNARSTRGFVVEAKPQRKSRRCDCDCYVFLASLQSLKIPEISTQL